MRRNAPQVGVVFRVWCQLGEGPGAWSREFRIEKVTPKRVVFTMIGWDEHKGSRKMLISRWYSERRAGTLEVVDA